MWADTTWTPHARAELILPSNLMGGAWATSARVIARWASAQVADGVNCRGGPVLAARWAAMADVSAMLSCGFDGAALVL